jgi:hypothetical protein
LLFTELSAVAGFCDGERPGMVDGVLEIFKIFDVAVYEE